MKGAISKEQLSHQGDVEPKFSVSCWNTVWQSALAPGLRGVMGGGYDSRL